MQNNEYIRNLSNREILTQLSHSSLRKFMKNSLTYHAEARGVLEEKGIDPKILKNRITPAQLSRFMKIGLSKNKVSMLLGISVSTLKKVRAQGAATAMSEKAKAAEKERLQQCLDFLRVKGCSQQDIAYILCTYVEKLKREFDIKSNLFPVSSERPSDAERRMWRKAYQTGNLYRELFTNENEESIL